MPETIIADDPERTPRLRGLSADDRRRLYAQWLRDRVAYSRAHNRPIMLSHRAALDLADLLDHL